MIKKYFKKIWKVNFFLLAGLFLFMAISFAACDKKGDDQDEEMILSTTNERLDSTEKQLTYQTSSMTMCSIKKAYENGWLTQTDLAYAMYYARGKVYTCKKSDWEKVQWEAAEKIDFTPEEACPAIDSQVERDIKRCKYDGFSHSENLTFEEFEQNYSFRFVGSYNGTFIITDVETIYWNYPAEVPPPVWIAGLVWYGGYKQDLFVFKYE